MTYRFWYTFLEGEVLEFNLENKGKTFTLEEADEIARRMVNKVIFGDNSMKWAVPGGSAGKLVKQALRSFVISKMAIREE